MACFYQTHPIGNLNAQVNFRETLKMHVTYKITLNIPRKREVYHFNWMCKTICLPIYIQRTFVQLKYVKMCPETHKLHHPV